MASSLITLHLHIVHMQLLCFLSKYGPLDAHGEWPVCARCTIRVCIYVPIIIYGTDWYRAPLGLYHITLISATPLCGRTLLFRTVHMPLCGRTILFCPYKLLHNKLILECSQTSVIE